MNCTFLGTKKERKNFFQHEQICVSNYIFIQLSHYIICIVCALSKKKMQIVTYVTKF